jgi:hypothetical protein
MIGVVLRHIVEAPDTTAFEVGAVAASGLRE